jgi:hypothetical protein
MVATFYTNRTRRRQAKAAKMKGNQLQKINGRHNDGRCYCEYSLALKYPD